MPITVQVPLIISDEQISDILDDAIESCSYWACFFGHARDAGTGHITSLSLKVRDENGQPEDEVILVTKESIGAAIELLKANPFESAGAYLAQLVGDVAEDSLYCRMDAFTTDVLVQLGVFGELVYG